MFPEICLRFKGYGHGTRSEQEVKLCKKCNLSWKPYIFYIYIFLFVSALIHRLCSCLT